MAVAVGRPATERVLEEVDVAGSANELAQGGDEGRTGHVGIVGRAWRDLVVAKFQRLTPLRANPSRSSSA